MPPVAIMTSAEAMRRVRITRPCSNIGSLPGTFTCTWTGDPFASTALVET